MKLKYQTFARPSVVLGAAARGRLSARVGLLGVGVRDLRVGGGGDEERSTVGGFEPFPLANVNLETIAITAILQRPGGTLQIVTVPDSVSGFLLLVLLVSLPSLPAASPVTCSTLQRSLSCSTCRGHSDAFSE